MSDYRTGLGWDIHPLASGRRLVLGGVEIPSDLGLAGHSDADVLAHAITDALLGAAALGDIGAHFPDTDARWKNADSLVLLQQALILVRTQGFRVVNIDATVVLEQPKLKDHRDAIRQKLAGTLAIEADCVSVKFKTAEKMGPVGERKACEALAVVALERE